MSRGSAGPARAATWIAAALALAASSCAAVKEPAAPAPKAGSLRVLFVGNSLTYANDLPGMVRDIAAASGESLDAEVVTIGGANLDDLWAEGRAPKALGRGGFRFVVLQQGPTSSLEGREMLIASSRRIAAEAERVGTRMAFYMVWPDAAYVESSHQSLPEAFAAVSGSYSAASRAVNGLLLPAGDAWQAALRKDPSLPFYGPDRFHPSPLGTLLAAITVYQGLFGHPPSRKPEKVAIGSGASIRLKDVLWADLVAAADEATRGSAKP